MSTPTQPTLRRGGVFSLLGALVAALAPHVSHLPLWTSITVAALLAWRGWRAWRGGALLPKWLLVVLTVLGIGAVVLTYGPRLGRDASVAMLAFMLALKVQELKALRDANVVVCLGFFLVITDFLYSQTIPTGLYMVVLVVWLTATLVAFQDHMRTVRPLMALRTAGLLAAQGVPLMLALFVLFPRVQGPLFGFPQATSAGVTGLSDTMAPGSLTNLGLSDEVAFRVQFDAPPPKPQSLYWRGPVMWDFDGRTWHIGSISSTATGGMRADTSGMPIRYTVTLEPHYMRWMFAIDLPAESPANSQLTNDYQLLAARPLRNRIRYSIQSHLDYRYGAAETPQALRYALRLPRNYNPKAVELAAELRTRSGNDREVIDHVLRFFRNEPFFYTLAPPELGRDSVDEFLFVTRRGFCEHYASTFVFLMRAAGIPARVVTGYQGGEMNPLGRYMIVRQADAHAWAEVWLRDEGWVRIDPTAAVSPARIQVGVGAALPDAGALPLSVPGGLHVLRQLRYSLDAVANAWNQWVLGYTPDRQLKLLRDFGFSSATWQTLVILLMAVAGTAVAVVALFVLWQLRLKPRDPTAQAWIRFRRKLERRGVQARAGEGPRDFAQRAALEQPSLQSQIQAIAQLYLGMRYAGQGGKLEARRLRSLVRAL